MTSLPYRSVETMSDGSIASGEGAVAGGVAAGHSLARDAAKTDTDNNAADFTDLAVPTPGAP